MSNEELIRHMLVTLKKVGKGLTTWEDAFIDSIEKYFEKKGTLTEKQFDTLERIYAEKTE